jgi:hypothetical protein
MFNFLINASVIFYRLFALKVTLFLGFLHWDSNLQRFSLKLMRGIDALSQTTLHISGVLRLSFYLLLWILRHSDVFCVSFYPYSLNLKAFRIADHLYVS